jgi:hypothetical protein
VEPYSAHFANDNVSDGEWLRLVGEKGWVALSHNKRIRWERDQLSDLMTFGATTFFIIGKGPHAAYARAVLRNINKIRRLLRERPRPFVGRIYQESNDVDVWVTYQQWMNGRQRTNRW